MFVISVFLKAFPRAFSRVRRRAACQGALKWKSWVLAGDPLGRRFFPEKRPEACPRPVPRPLAPTGPRQLSEVEQLCGTAFLPAGLNHASESAGQTSRRGLLQGAASSHCPPVPPPPVSFPLLSPRPEASATTRVTSSGYPEFMCTCSISRTE